VSIAAVTALSVVLGSCAASPEPATPVELTFASWVFISDQQQAFMDEVESKSEGTITFTILENWTEPDGVEKLSDEFAMANAIASGEIDAGWTSTRSFPALGIDGFRSIEAPFLIQSLHATNAIVSGQIGTDALTALDGSGVTGLAIYPGTMRYPLTAGEPLRAPGDWAGKDILYYSPEEDGVQARTVRALGGEPVNVGLHIIDDLKAGLYDGGFDSLGDVAAGGATPRGPFLTSNLVMWPTVLFLVINSDRFESLTESQQDVLVSAAEHAAAAETAAGVDPTIAESVCGTSARFGTATPDDLTALRAAVQPVYDWLEDDPAEAPLLTALQDIADEHPEPDAVSVPEGCAWDPSLVG
jgi:TRAP-type C4-dicarboxylate transport system substrate-binding protein